MQECQKKYLSRLVVNWDHPTWFGVVGDNIAIMWVMVRVSERCRTMPSVHPGEQRVSSTLHTDQRPH